ncbi:putative MOP flippase [Lyophyllum shimeji]|uniref:MOP flippase n=1 Tax=Lyophyllum shimeji TaxID=47721 RepID=A0A9P3PID9_LYOSH|nr:putative MOP flippase [Lyophyllum shimeji]
MILRKPQPQHSLGDIMTWLSIAGRLGPDELSAAAIASMIAFVTGESTSLTSLLYIDLTIFFDGVRCYILLCILFIPVGDFSSVIEPVLLALGQPASLTRDVQIFLRVLTLGAPGYIGFESLKKYLPCQGIMRASPAVLLVISPVNVVLNLWLIHGTSLGLLGSPVALSITY